MGKSILDEQDKNLLVVTAVEGYAQKHSVDAVSAYHELRQNNVLEFIRNQYEVLHTQDLDEAVLFAEDVMVRTQK